MLHPPMSHVGYVSWQVLEPVVLSCCHQPLLVLPLESGVRVPLRKDTAPDVSHGGRPGRGGRGGRGRGGRGGQGAGPALPSVVDEMPREMPAPEPPEHLECVVCLNHRRTHASIPCGHWSLCDECAQQQQLRGAPCPICQQPVSAVVRIYSS